MNNSSTTVQSQQQSNYQINMQNRQQPLDQQQITNDNPPVQTEKYGLNFVSKEAPVPEDDVESKYIEQILRNDYNWYESREDSRKREEVLNKLNTYVKTAIYNLAIKKGFTVENAKEAGGKIFTFGSYRLGIVGPGDDIDVLCVGPDHADRDEFFDEMTNQWMKEKEITEISPVKDAYVPIIKINFSGIAIDLLVARLSFKSIDDKLESLQDDSIWKNCRRECIWSLNGCRVTNMILSLVPNTENFRLTLRAIKWWAKKRGIYSNSIGYPGGVAWAILVAKVCQMFPWLKPNKLIRKFFDVYSNWNWMNPVQINEVKREIGFNCPIEVWKVKDAKCFNIITPAFPCQNTNYNTTETTKNVMLFEFEKFAKYTENIKMSESNPECSWKGFFEEIDFFSQFEVFWQIDILATNPKDFKYWDGFVESKLRLLIKSFMMYQQIIWRPYTNGFKLSDPVFKCRKTYFYGIDFVDPDILYPNAPKEVKDDWWVINWRNSVKEFILKIQDKRINPKEMNFRLSVKNVIDLPIEILQKKKHDDLSSWNKKRKWE